MKSTFLTLCWLLGLCMLASTVSISKMRVSLASDIVVPASDSSKLKALTLENGMQALLISHPSATLAGIAIQVGAGSLSDFDYMPGIAHFIEHTIIMGSEKYPGENDFYDFISQNGGISNAFTSGEVTDVHYQVNTDALDRSLEIFADMYQHPLFTYDVAQLECFSIESEFQMNYNELSFHLEGVLKALYDPGHPATKFTTGSYKTLVKDVLSAGRNFSEEMRQFHQKYYHSNIMNMVIISNETTANMEQMVKKHFSSLTPDNSLPKDLYDQLPKPLNKNLKSYAQILLDSPGSLITICFELSPANKNLKVNPVRYLDYLLSDSGVGSLNEYLLSTGLVVGFQANIFDETSYHTLVIFNIQVVDEGIFYSEFFVRTIMDYMEFLKAEAINEEVYQTYATAKKMSFDYANTESDMIMERASDIATHISDYGIDNAFTNGQLLQEYDEQVIRALFDEINPDNMVIIYSSELFQLDPKILPDHVEDVRTVGDPLKVTQKGLHADKSHTGAEFSPFILIEESASKHQKSEMESQGSSSSKTYLTQAGNIRFQAVDQYLPTYNTRFTYNALPQEFFDVVKYPIARQNAEALFGRPNFALPDTNEYLSENTDLICDSDDQALCKKEFKADADKKPKAYPLGDDATLWYQLDRSFLVPRAVVSLVLTSPDALKDIDSYAEFTLFCAQMRVIPETYLSGLIAGGFQISIYCERANLIMSVEGFTDKLDEAVGSLAYAIENMVVDEGIYEQLVEIAAAEEYAMEFLGPRQRTEVLLKYLYDSHYMGEPLAAAITNIDPKKWMKKYSDSRRKPFYYEGLAIGNIELKDATRYLLELVDALGLEFVAESKIPDDSVKLLEDTYIAYREWNSLEDSNDNAILNYYQIGPKSPEALATAALLQTVFRNEAFDELRNIKQLGYVVFARVAVYPNALGLIVEIQGPVKDSNELDKEIELFVGHFYEYLKGISDEEFSNMQDAYLSVLEGDPATLLDKANIYLAAVARPNNDFKSLEKLSAETKNLKKEDAIKLFKKSMIDSPNKISIQIWANTAETIPLVGLNVQDTFAKKKESVVIDSVDDFIGSFK